MINVSCHLMDRAVGITRSSAFNVWNDNQLKRRMNCRWIYQSNKTSQSQTTTWRTKCQQSANHSIWLHHQFGTRSHSGAPRVAIKNNVTFHEYLWISDQYQVIFCWSVGDHFALRGRVHHGSQKYCVAGWIEPATGRVAGKIQDHFHRSWILWVKSL